MPASQQRATAGGPVSPIPILLRFISCGLLAVALGILWRVTLAPPTVGVGSAGLGDLLPSSTPLNSVMSEGA